MGCFWIHENLVKEVQVREGNYIIMLLVGFIAFRKKYFISNVEERSYIPERLNNLPTTTQLEKCRAEI